MNTILFERISKKKKKKEVKKEIFTPCLSFSARSDLLSYRKTRIAIQIEIKTKAATTKLSTRQFYWIDTRTR